MGISHPLSDEFDAPRGGVLSPEGTPPPPPPASCCSGDQDYLEHVVSRMDTLAGIAIKYGVEISDIKRANSLASDSQMFAHKTLLIPLPGRHMPSSVRSNGSGQGMERSWAPNHQQNRDVTDSLDSSKCKSDQQRTSLAMSILQRCYGLTCEKGVSMSMDCSTEMSLCSKGSFQRISSETLLTSSTAPDTQSTDRSWDPEDPMNGFSATNGATGIKSDGATKAEQDGSMRRRQKGEADRLPSTADAQDDILADPIKIIKSLLTRPISSTRPNTDTGSPDCTPKSSISFLNGFKFVRNSPSAAKPASSARRTKSALD